MNEYTQFVHLQIYICIIYFNCKLINMTFWEIVGLLNKVVFRMCIRCKRTFT